VLRALGWPHLDFEAARAQDFGVELEVVPAPDAAGVRVAYDDGLASFHLRIIALSPGVTLA
jgi:hypothetical protein